MPKDAYGEPRLTPYFSPHRRLLAAAQNEHAVRAASVPQQAFLRTSDTASLDADVFRTPPLRRLVKKTTLACQRAVVASPQRKPCRRQTRRRTMLRLLALTLIAATRAERQQVGDDGQAKRLFESMFPREWVFEQQFEGRGKGRKNGSVRVKLDKSRIAKFRGGLKGIWNLKETKKPNFLELELPLNKADDKYLLYQVNCRPGKYFDNAVNFDEEGTIYEVSSFVPTPETMKPVGKFSVRPIAAKPMLDRSLRC